MAIKGITLRWLQNSFGLILAVLVAVELGAAFLLRQYIYDSIRQGIYARSSVLTTYIESFAYGTSSEIFNGARRFVESFSDKDKVEIMFINRKGQVDISSNGFLPGSDIPKPDYDRAIASENGMGEWTGSLPSGENVMAVTKVFRGSDGAITCAVRYVVSLDAADTQILLTIAIFFSVGLAVIFFVIVSSRYFIKSIVTPIREIGRTARRVAMGDFAARINKRYDDEIGELCDTINHMASELATSEKIKNEFISSVSHELRTPLTAIKGWAETILSCPPSDKSTVSKGMRVIIRETERLSYMVEELLDFSRIQSGRFSLLLEKLDILAELGEAVLIFEERARSEGVEIEYLEPETLPAVFGDRNRLRQIFVNVLDNALKYTDENGKITIKPELEGEKIKITIKDTGCGIKAEDLPKIKQKFYKGSGARKGSGIGLAIVDEIVKLHGGSIDIESVEGAGTTVIIMLPIASKKIEEITMQIPLIKEEKS